MVQKITPQKFVNSSLEQLFYNREKIIRRLKEVKEELNCVEAKIATSACPYYLGQIVNYRYKTKMTKAIISRLQFSPENPFYQIYLKKLIPKKKATLIAQTFLNLKTVNNFYFDSEFEFIPSEDESISAPINTAESADPELLKWLLKEKVITVSSVSHEDKTVEAIMRSAELGKSFTELGFKHDLKEMIECLNKPFNGSTLFRRKPKS